MRNKFETFHVLADSAEVVDIIDYFVEWLVEKAKL